MKRQSRKMTWYVCSCGSVITFTCFEMLSLVLSTDKVRVLEVSHRTLVNGNFHRFMPVWTMLLLSVILFMYKIYYVIFKDIFF